MYFACNEKRNYHSQCSMGRRSKKDKRGSSNQAGKSKVKFKLSSFSCSNGIHYDVPSFHDKRYVRNKYHDFSACCHENKKLEKPYGKF